MSGPCDIYLAAGTPCVAAHSVIRSLYSAPKATALYEITRGSDNLTQTINTHPSSGIAATAGVAAFCLDGTCTITTIYDQSPKLNHITLAPPGGAHHAADLGVNATRESLTVAGTSVYAAMFEGTGHGYRKEDTTGVATGDDPETIYMVTSGTHFNGGCCFDYGNAETDALDHGPGTMEAVYWGNSSGWGKGKGDGPWVMGDLENGLFAGQDHVAAEPSVVGMKFVTAMVKGDSGNHWAIKVGDAQKGALKTVFDGERPKGYSPMKKQGSIILGIGGDNSDRSVGTFYEGVMTAGYSTDAADDAVQANIISTLYGK